MCRDFFFFFVWRGKLWFPRGGIKTSHRLFLISFFLKKKICINFWCYTATSCPPTARAVGGWGITVFSLYNHKLPGNHGLSRDTAMLSPFTHTNTHTLCIHTMAHVITITLQFFFVLFLSAACRTLSENVPFPRLFPMTRQRRKACKRLCVCASLEKKKKNEPQGTCLSTKKKIF